MVSELRPLLPQNDTLVLRRAPKRADPDQPTPLVTDAVVVGIAALCPRLVELSLHHCPIAGTDCLHTESRDVLFRVLELLDVRHCFGLQIDNLDTVDAQPSDDSTLLRLVQAYTLRGCVVKSAIGESGSAYSACRDATSDPSIWEVNESF